MLIFKLINCELRFMFIALQYAFHCIYCIPLCV